MPGHIFISYSRQDKDFAEHLAGDLSRYYDVWIDREDIHGGVKWEQSIDQGIRECALFLVVVSTSSNNSEWVSRETIRASNLKKHRIPLLFEGELPLRLLDLQYVDFQGDYDGGLRDLLEALKELLPSPKPSRTDIDQLIGAGIREYLTGNFPSANSLIGQAIALDSTIAPTAQSFWDTLQSAMPSNLSERYMKHIRILERARRLEEKIYPDNVQAYEWSVEIDAPDNVLDQIDYVQYTLHQTFKNPVRTVRARQTRFRLTGGAWGTFLIPVEVFFKDGTMGRTEYELTFEAEWTD